MRTARNREDQGKGADWLAPLFGEAWAQQPLDLFSDRVKSLAATGLLNPRSLSADEIQALAASVMSFVVNNDR
jgi:hypothetical protein